MHASTHGKLGRAALTLAAILDTARARSNRRRAAAARRPTPTSGALAPPVPENFESTTTSYDGTPTQITAKTSPGNRVSGKRLPGGEPYDPFWGQPGSLSIAEGSSGHQANQKSRPIAWAVATFIALAFVTVGFGLIYLWPWLFIAGLIAVVAGVLAGWATGIMADRGDPNQTGEALTSKRM
jgi:hypothetical protein